MSIRDEIIDIIHKEMYTSQDGELLYADDAADVILAMTEISNAQAKIAELENALAAASGTIAAMRDNVAAGQARNAQLQDTLQDIASTGVGWTVQAARDALKSKPW
jgi:uncharacterized coiled-coil protein SlyX